MRLATLMEDGKNWHVFSGCSLCWYLSWEKESTLKVVRRRKAQISFNSWALIASSLVILMLLVVPLPPSVHRSIVCVHTYGCTWSKVYTLYVLHFLPAKADCFLSAVLSAASVSQQCTIVKKSEREENFHFHISSL